MCIAVTLLVRIREMLVPYASLGPLLKLCIFIPHKSCDVEATEAALHPIVGSFKVDSHMRFCFCIVLCDPM